MSMQSLGSQSVGHDLASEPQEQCSTFLLRNRSYTVLSLPGAWESQLLQTLMAGRAAASL